MVKKILKILFSVIGSLLLLVIIVVFLVAVGVFNNAIAGFIGKQAAKSINGELLIGSIEGKLISGLSIKNINIIHEKDTILHGDELLLSYKLKGLFKKQVEIDVLGLRGFRMQLEQDRDSVWNFTKIIKPSEEEKDSTKSSSGWKIILHELKAENLVADIVTIDTASMIPAHAELGFTMNAVADGDTIRAEMKSFRLVTGNPDFEINEFRVRIEKEGDMLAWNNMVLELPNSLLSSQGNYDIGGEGAADVMMELQPLDFDDLRRILPELTINGSPDIRAAINGNSGRYDFTLNIKEENQSADLSGYLADLKGNPEYALDIIAGNIDVSHWLPETRLKTSIGADMGITGQGFNIKENNIDLSGSFTGLSYQDYTTEKVSITVSKKKDQASGSVDAATFIGDADLKFFIQSLFTKPAYDILLSYSDVDLSRFVDSLGTNLNGILQVTGSGTTMNDLNAGFVFRSDTSEVLAGVIGEFGITGNYNRGEYNFTTGEIVTPWFRLEADGGGNLRTTHSIDFEFEPLEYDTLLAFMGLPDFDLEGKISGNVRGNADSIFVDARANLDNIFYDSITVSSADAVAEAVLIKGKYAAGLELKAESIGMGSMAIRSAEVDGTIVDSLIKADLRIIYNDSLSADFSGSVEGFSSPFITINDLGITYNNIEWRSGHDSATISMDEAGVSINGFNLRSGDQEIAADGHFSFEGDENITLAINALDLEKLPLYLFVPYDISGILTTRFTLKGTAETPLIEGFIEADDVAVNDFRVDSIRSFADYRDNLLTYSADAQPEGFEPVALSVNIPARISLKDSIMLMKDDNRFSASLKFDSLDLEKVFSAIQVENTTVKGFSSADIRLRNTIARPDVSGVFRINNGVVENTFYGADYKNIQFNGRIDSSRITIGNLSARTGKGRLNADGFVGIQYTDSIEANDLGLNIRASDFQAVKSGSLELNFDSDIKLSGKVGKPLFGGKLTVNSSKINVDYFTAKLSEKSDDPDPPLLLQALNDSVRVDADADTSSAVSFSGTSFYKNLEGEIVADIPGNTWVSGKDMNFEIEGTIRGVKSGDAMNLFGDLNVKRGYYKIYGRTFDFEKGEIHFTGGSDFNPDVEFEIVYRFRDIEKELKELTLLVTGKVMAPTLAFTMDDERLEEKDAISYIIFGKSVAQLGEGERSRISGEELAMGAAVTQLSSALKGVLQETAGVDVFEVAGGEDWKSGSFTIGKYITNNFFVSYERSFDFDKQTKTADTEKIMLEYQFLRNLVMKVTNQEINSGFDLIFKKTWK